MTVKVYLVVLIKKYNRMINFILKLWVQLILLSHLLRFYYKILGLRPIIKSFKVTLLIRKSLLRLRLNKGKNRRTLTKVISNKITRHFKFFSVLFRFYGVETFIQGFYPTLKAYINNKFEGWDHPNIWKLVTFDILSAFYSTSKYYQINNQKLYNEWTNLMFKWYENNWKPDIEKLYRDSIGDWFKDMDPLRIDEFLK